MAMRHSDTWDGTERGVQEPGDDERVRDERETVERVFTVTYTDADGKEQTESISAAAPALQWCGDGDQMSN